MSEIPKTIELNHLKPNCYLSQDEEVRHDFTEDELHALKTELFTISIQSQNRQELKELIVIMINDLPKEDLIEALQDLPLSRNYGDDGLKSLKKEFPILLKKINDGYEIREDTVYGFAHYDIHKMAFYGSDGKFIYDRPLRNTERQSTIITELNSKAS